MIFLFIQSEQRCVFRSASCLLHFATCVRNASKSLDCIIHLQQEPAWDGIELMNGVKYVRPGGGFVPNFPLTLKSDVNGANEHKLYTHLKVNLSLLYSGSSSRTVNHIISRYQNLAILRTVILA